jgi:hypothetical protein
MSDQTYSWERKPKVVDVKFAIPSPVLLGERIYKPQRQPAGVDVFGFVIWFCGKAIPVARITTTSGRESYVFSYNDLPSKIINDKNAFDFSPQKRMKALFDLADKPWGAIDFTAVKLPGHAVAQKISIDEMHRKLNAPIFCHADGVPEMMGDDANYARRDGLCQYSSSVIINPVLSVVLMHRRIDPFSAFNSIERYLTNELAKRDVKRDGSIKDHPVLDKIKAESHGFDKWSFRKRQRRGNLSE